LFWTPRARIFPRVGQLGEGEQMGSVYKQPEREVDDSCHNWREPSRWKGIQRGDKGGLARGARGAMGIAPCIYVTVMYVPE
jgi:hypothetical protein